MKKTIIAIVLIWVLTLSSVTAVSAAEIPSAAGGAEDWPRLVSVSPTASGITVRWETYPDAAMYRLFYKGTSGWVRIGDTTQTSLTHAGLSNGASYTYTVRALDWSGVYCSSFDRVGLSATFLSVPKLGGVTNDYGGQRVRWSAVDGAAKYRVYIKSSSGWKVVGTTAKTSFLYRGVQPGGSYTYTVRCYTSDGAQPLSYFDRGGVSAVYRPAPEILGFKPAQGGIEVSWSSVAGADSYRLYCKAASGWNRVATIAATSVVHRDLTDGEEYIYTVRALDRDGELITGYNTAGWRYTYFLPPALSDVTYADGGYTVRWQKAANALGCHLYRRTPDSDWKLMLHTRKRTSFTDLSADPQTPYAYVLSYVDREERRVNVLSADTVYYVGGELADGEIEWGGRTLTFDHGHLRRGFVEIDGRLYYYNSAGVKMKNGIVGSAGEGYTVADANGVCCTAQEIRLAAKFMMEHASGNTLDERMKTGYLYLSHRFPYRRTYDHPSKASELPALAIDMFTNESGNCYRYAACFACIARIAGYRARVVIGTTEGNPHGWVEVLVNGEWLICDPDADIPRYRNPDYYSYMMRYHYWQLTPITRCEIVINEDGSAIWK